MIAVNLKKNVLKLSFKHIVLGCLLFGALLAANLVHAQGDPETKVIQLSGVILNADSTDAIPGVNIYVPTKGRGTSSNHFGYFSMPVAAGDSVVFSFIGLERQSFKVPEDTDKDQISLILTMMEDAYTLSEVEVMPYPTE